MKSTIGIIATRTADNWGGSEELWSQAATRLVAEGVSVAASIHARAPLHYRVKNLVDGGVRLWVRSEKYSILQRMRRRVILGRQSDLLIEIEKFLNLVQPQLVIFSTGGIFPPIEWLELCQKKALPFVTIGQANSDYFWFEDASATRYRRALASAVRCFFVSKANLRLAEKQIGGELSNAEVVRNPFNVHFDSSSAWPSFAENGELRLACVGRLELAAKGQDILLEALANTVWMSRRWRLNLYGIGPMKNVIERLIQYFELGDHVNIVGWASRVEDIWAENHALVMPSRVEGLPLVIVEAMLCGRPVVATDVAGSEIVEDGVTGFLADAPTVPSMARALERLWEHRHNLRMMGEVAAKSIRKCVPADPVGVFSHKIQCLLDGI